MIQKAFKIIVLLVVLTLMSCKDSGQESSIETLSPSNTKVPTGNASFPEPIGVVNDYSNLFTDLEQEDLNRILRTYEEATTRQIVIVTVDSIMPYTDIQAYATDLGNHWGVGTQGTNNGLTIVICSPCKQLAIATGLGTEEILTNSICAEVIEQTIIPDIQRGALYRGLKNGIIALIQKWN